ncbi:MAG: hypothetical protein K2O35_04310, partial [Clostridia bacterium]|nr:hypothetical protein [Clostridia bacterium]
MMISVLLLAIMTATTLFVPAQEIAQADTETSDIGKITVDGYESNPTSKVFNGDKLRSLYSQIVGKENATYADLVKKLSDATDNKMCSADFRTTSIDGKEIYVTIDGMKWAAMYLANNKSGQPVLTLWLVDSNDIDDSNYSSYVYNDYTASSLGDYPALMYATSQLRAICLNNGGIYGTSITTYDTAVQKADHPFAKFTMPNGTYDGVELKGSLYDFIEIPEQMEWQEFESSEKNGDPDPTNYENDAWSTEVNVFKSLNRTPLTDIVGYSNWNKDKLWVPSYAESGYYVRNYSYRGMWRESDEVFDSSSYYWTRSVPPSRYSDAYSNKGSSSIVTTTWNIRPAFHLNLSEVEKSTTVAVPSQGEKKKDFYIDDNTDLEFNLNGVDTTKLDITCVSQPVSGETAGTMTYKASTFGLVTLKASKVGKYTVTVKPKNGECWSSGTATPVEYTFYIKYLVDEPALIGQTGALSISKNYADGEQEIKFAKEFYDATKYDIKPNTSPSGLTFDDSSGEAIFKVKDADTYTASVELKDKTLMEWNADNLDTSKVSGDTANKTITITIQPRLLMISLDPNGAWSVPYGEVGSFAFTDDRVNTDDVIRFTTTYALKDGSGSSVTLTNTTTGNRTEFSIPPSLAKGVYELSITLNSSGQGKNYVLNGSPIKKEFSVVDKEIDLEQADIIWGYENLRVSNGEWQRLGAWDNNTVVLNYTGAEFKWSVDEIALAQKGVKVDYDGLGYENAVATNSGSAIYTTTVHLLPIVETSILNTKTFTIKWKIDQGLYDLSGVSWDYADGELEYTGRGQEVKLTGLLSSLVPQYTGNRQTNVGDNYLAKVNGFVNNDSNFKDPDINDPTTYIYKDGETFPWELVWKIVKKKISLSWEAKEAVDVNGRNFTYYVAAGEDADKISGYEYYRGDDYSSSGGGSATGSPIKFEDIVVVEKQVDSYWAVAILSAEYDNNYEIVSNKARLFSVGSTNDEVKVELNGGNHKFTYDGNAHGNELKVTTSALSVNDIVKTYYRGSEVNENNRLEGAPTDAGKYLLVMSLSAQDEEDFVLSTSRIEFEIEKAKIMAVWNTEGQIPVISNLNDNLKEIVGYIYYDAEGNQLEDGAQLEVGKTYSVKAILKGDYGKNYEFVAQDGETVLDDPTTTEEEEFTVKDSNNGDGNGIGGVGSGNQGGDGNGGGNVNFDNV